MASLRPTWKGLVVMALLSGTAASVSAQSRGEYEIKAAYLFSFARFVEWPADRDRASAFGICVLGVDPFGAALDSMVSGNTLAGRAVVARRLTTVAEAEPDCRILFISASEERQLGAIVAALRGTSVLTVSDMPRFVGRGGMIQFQTVGNRIRFDIDLPPAASAGLMLSSELLRVASSVRRDGGER